MTRYAFSLIAAALASAQPTSALEVTAHNLSRDADVGIAARLEAMQASIQAAFNDFVAKNQACTAKAALYAPADPAADADGCKALPSTPSGAVTAFNSTACPAGWAVLTGARGRVIVGVGDSTDPADPTRANYLLGSYGGETKHQLTIAEMPSHTHDSEDRYETASTVMRKGTDSWAVSKLNTKYRTVTSAPTGGDQPHENRMPFIALLYCYKL